VAACLRGEAAAWGEAGAATPPTAALLGKILKASLDIEARESVGAFLGTLPADEEAALSELLIGPPIKNSTEVASDCWRDLCGRSIKRKIDAIQARIRGGDLPLSEVANLHKEMLDLQKRLPDIPRPFPGT
jgi:DNA primase